MSIRRTRSRSGLAIMAVAVVLNLLCLSAIAQPPKPLKLSKRIQVVLQGEVLPAYRSGDAVTLVNKLSPLLTRVSLDERITIDDLLDQQGLPSTAEMLTEMRLKLIRFGASASVPPPQGQELQALLSRLSDQVQAAISLRSSHAAMADPMPSLTSFREYEELLWSIHVLNNELLNAHTTARTAVALCSAHAKDEERLAIPDFEAQVLAVKEFAADLKERQLELRYRRLLFADHSLARTTDVKERMHAAYAADFDSEVLLAFIAERKALGDEASPQRRSALAAADFAETVQRTRESTANQAGELTGKTRLFFDGLHWWFRGRYGLGSEQGGLLKSHLATQSREALTALMMPRQSPQPSDPALGGLRRTPTYDRRHHYNWSTNQPRFTTTTSYFH